MIAQRRPPPSPATFSEWLQKGGSRRLEATVGDAPDVSTLGRLYASHLVESLSELRTLCPGRTSLFYTGLGWSAASELPRYVLPFH